MRTGEGHPDIKKSKTKTNRHLFFYIFLYIFLGLFPEIQIYQHALYYMKYYITIHYDRNLNKTDL